MQADNEDFELKGGVVTSVGHELYSFFHSWMTALLSFEKWIWDGLPLLDFIVILKGFPHVSVSLSCLVIEKMQIHAHFALFIRRRLAPRIKFPSDFYF